MWKHEFEKIQNQIDQGIEFTRVQKAVRLPIKGNRLKTTVNQTFVLRVVPELAIWTHMGSLPTVNIGYHMNNYKSQNKK